MEALETALDRRSKAELIVIVRRMLDRYPDLEQVLELSIVAAAEDAPPVDADFIGRQAGNAFGGAGYGEWKWTGASRTSADTSGRGKSVPQTTASDGASLDNHERFRRRLLCSNGLYLDPYRSGIFCRFLRLMGLLQSVRGRIRRNELLDGDLKEAPGGGKVYPVIHLAHPGIVMRLATERDRWPFVHRTEHIPVAREALEELL